MPYIPADRRPVLDSPINNISWLIMSEGELNYVVTRLVREYVRSAGGNYAAWNAGIGVLECAKLELYRMGVAPYEDVKRELNGDVV